MPPHSPVLSGLLLALILCGCERQPAKTPQGDPPPAAPPRPVFTPVDLQPQANQRLNIPPQPRGQGNNLADLPRGKQTLEGVPFLIGKSYIQLGSQRFPAKVLLVRGIAVDQKVKRLHFLHAASFSGIHRNDGSGQQDGEKIGSYVIHFTDGSKAEAPIVYGHDVRDWWNWDSSKPATHGRVAWTGTNTYAAQLKVSVRLYVSHWENPHPKKTIATVDFRSANSTSAPFCVAITAER